MFEHMFALSTQDGHLYVRDGRAVRQGWTFVRIAATWQLLSVSGGHLCASCKHRAPWTFVRQLETAAAVRPGWTSVYELQPLGLHNKFTNLL
jgi:hypothetical protein